MGKNYITRYRCPDCQLPCYDEDDAMNHCPREADEVYECEICGYETSDNTDAASSCEYHNCEYHNLA